MKDLGQLIKIIDFGSGYQNKYLGQVIGNSSQVTGSSQCIIQSLKI